MDEGDLHRFVDTAEPRMHQCRGVMWVLSGRAEANLAKLKNILAKSRLRGEAYAFCYSTKQMKSYGHF